MFYRGKYATNYNFLIRNGQTVYFALNDSKTIVKAKVVKNERCYNWAYKPSTHGKMRLPDFNNFIIIKSLDPRYYFNHGGSGSRDPVNDGVGTSPAEITKFNQAYSIKDRRNNENFNREFRFQRMENL